VPLAAGAKGKDVVQARGATASATGAASAGEGTATGVCPARAARRRRRPRKNASVNCRPDGKHRSGLCFAQFHSVEFLMFPFPFLPAALVLPSRSS
jgi:hypothetical protein